MPLAQRWILACLRNRTFFSLEDLNAAIAEMRLEKLNRRPFQKLVVRLREQSIGWSASRQPAGNRVWAKGRVNIDYHVEHDRRLYSVHYSLVGEVTNLRVTASVVDIFLHETRGEPRTPVDTQGHGQDDPWNTGQEPPRVRRMATVADE